MNISFIRYIIGYVITIESVTMLLPALVALIYNESAGSAYLMCAIAFLIVGILLIIKKPKSNQLFAREGFALVGLSWIILSVIGALPLYLSGDVETYIDGLFEISSGFTTTGATILSNVEAISKAGLFWRSFSHWLGGMGVFVFLLSIMPMAGGNNIHLLRAESPGPSVGKLVPKLRDTAKILYAIYFVMTVIMFVMLLVAKMPVFDAINISLGTAGTGGFAIKNDSIAGYTDAMKWIITAFMILFGVNFNAYFLLLGRNKKEAFKVEEVKWYFLIIIASVILITINIVDIYGNVYDSVREAAFHVGSVITTTGFATTDYNLWPTLSKVIIVALSFMGACAGSTGGGIKVVRIVLVLKAIKREIENYVHPRLVRSVRMEGKVVDDTGLRGIFVFLGAYATIFVISLVLISFDQFDIVTNFTAIAATMSNVGPGLEVVGPCGNFSGFSDFSKCVLIFDMLAGRLEFFPMLVLFSPFMWKRK